MKQTVLITGGTRGIGLACARAFVAGGWSVTVVARTASELAEVRTELSVATIEADLGTEAGIAAIPVHPYDAIILNAAAFQPGNLLGDEGDVFEQLFPVNVLANHRLARRLLPPMIERDSGHLIVIGSTGTDHWKPHMTAYVATKYALRGLFLGWRQELALSRVRCTLVAPAATLTSSWDNETPPDDILQPEEVAEVVLSAVREGREGRLVVVG